MYLTVGVSRHTHQARGVVSVHVARSARYRTIQTRASFRCSQQGHLSGYAAISTPNAKDDLALV